MRIEERLGRMTALTAVAAAWLVALTVALPAEHADPLQVSAVRLGAARMRSLRVAGFGAAYLDGAGRLEGRSGASARHAVARYTATYDLVGGRADGRAALVARGPAGDTLDLSADVLASPHGFVVYARAAGARVRPLTSGVEVFFEAGRRRYAGVITPEGDVDRVRVSSRDTTDPRGTEIRYRDYETLAGGIRFPRHVVETRDGVLALDVWVTGVEPVWNAPRDLAALRASGGGAR